MSEDPVGFNGGINKYINISDSIIYWFKFGVYRDKDKKRREKYHESVWDKIISEAFFYYWLGGRDRSKSTEDRAGEFILAGMLFIFGGIGYLLVFAIL